MGGRVVAFRNRLLPQIRAFTDLHGLDILDFGCGTGSTTVVLAESAESARITAVDIDPGSLEIARLRFDHHGVASRITTFHITPIHGTGDLDLQSESFDFILLNGVLEHVVPFRARARVLLEIWRVLRPGGLLFISETPNLLWPIDRHTTGLPFIPWLPSRVAYLAAVACRRHNRGADLDVRGRRGMTYWEIVGPLKSAGSVEVLNIIKTGNLLFPAGMGAGDTASFKRKLGTFILERILGQLLTSLGVPVVAVGPFIEYLCLRKQRTADQFQEINGVILRHLRKNGESVL